MIKIAALATALMCAAPADVLSAGSDPADPTVRIRGLSDAAYVGGMPPAAMEIAKDAAERMEQTLGGPRPTCPPADARLGTIVATDIGSAPPEVQGQESPLLSGLQALLASDRQVVRDTAAFVLGEIGPAAVPVVPALRGHDIHRPPWFSHALGRITCEPFGISDPMRLVPPAVRKQWNDEPVRRDGAAERVRVSAMLLSHRSLAWPDGYFGAVLDHFDVKEDAGEIEPEWVETLVHRFIDPDEDLDLRLDIASLLRRLGSTVAPFGNRIAAIPTDTDDRLSQSVAEVLVASGGMHAPGAARILMERHEYSSRQLPRDLCEIAGASDVLSPALRRRLGGDNWDEAESAIELLACLDATANATDIRAALSHVSWKVQLTAIRALAQSGPIDQTALDALSRIEKQHWSGLVREAARKAFRLAREGSAQGGSAESEDEETVISFPCFHRCLTDHGRRCGDENGIVDGRYSSESWGDIDVEWQRARRRPPPDGFPFVPEADSRPGYGTDTYLRVKGGWLYGTDRWHYDGEVAYVDNQGQAHEIGEWGVDAVAIIQTPHFGTTFLGGSIFEAGEVGVLATLERGDGGWRFGRKLGLPSPPWGWAFAPDGTLLVADPYEAVAVHRDGRIEPLECPVRQPRQVPRSLLGLAQTARERSAQKRIELDDAIRVHERLLAHQRRGYEDLMAHPEKRHPWQTPEILRSHLVSILSGTIDKYVEAGQPERALSLLDDIPFDRGEIPADTLFTLHANAGHAAEARTVVDSSTSADALQLRAALAIGERRLADAREALDARAQLERSQQVAANPFVELLNAIAHGGRQGGPAGGGPPSEEASWPAPILEYLNGALPERGLVLASHRRDGTVDPERLCEALFYKGLQLAAAGKIQAARQHFRATARLGITHYYEHALSLVLLEAKDAG